MKKLYLLLCSLVMAVFCFVVNVFADVDGVEISKSLFEKLGGWQVVVVICCFVLIWIVRATKTKKDDEILDKYVTTDELLITSHKDLQLLQQEEVKSYINNLYVLCNYVLEPIRNYYGKPITITSGFRGKTLNKKVGGSLTSQHCLGEVADILVKDKTVDEVFEDIRSGKINIIYRQLIKEKINGKF